MSDWWVHLSWSQATSVVLTIGLVIGAGWLFKGPRRRFPKTSSHPSFFSDSRRDTPR